MGGSRGGSKGGSKGGSRVRQEKGPGLDPGEVRDGSRDGPGELWE